MRNADRPAIPPGTVLLVLIAEDEEPIALALADLIEEVGYQTLVAQNGQRALELAREHHPDLIITDLMMPYLSGRDMIAALHADGNNLPNTVPPIILMTAAGQARIRDSGADAVLLKPFELEEVEALLHRFLPPPAPPG